MNVPAAKIYFPREDRKEILNKIDEILISGQMTLGKYGSEFEQKFAEYIGTRYAIAVNSGTSALEICIRALNSKGSSWIVPANTFFATPAAVIHAGGRVIFADSDESLCLDSESVKERIRRDTVGVIIVHIGGMISPQVIAIKEICEDNDLFLIEDAAHAHGSTLSGKKAGSFGEAATFSFYPTKVITSAEGGMITTDNDALYRRALVLRDQGKAGFYGNVHTELGYNWRMSEIHAAIGLSQFSRLDEFIEYRKGIAKFYDANIKRIQDIDLIKIPLEVESNYYKYVVMLGSDIDRVSLKKELKDAYGVILSGEVYELPCHLQPVFKELHNSEDYKLPIAEETCKRQICLPIFVTMTDEQANHVIHSLEEVLG